MHKVLWFLFKLKISMATELIVFLYKKAQHQVGDVCYGYFYAPPPLNAVSLDARGETASYG